MSLRHLNVGLMDQYDLEYNSYGIILVSHVTKLITKSKPTQRSSVQCFPGYIVQKFEYQSYGGWYHWKADVIIFNLIPNSWLFIIWISFDQSKQIKGHQIIVLFWKPQINRVITWCVNGIDTKFKRVGCEVMCAEPH